jgi:hypothetical protein
MHVTLTWDRTIDRHTHSPIRRPPPHLLLGACGVAHHRRASQRLRWQHGRRLLLRRGLWGCRLRRWQHGRWLLCWQHGRRLLRRWQHGRRLLRRWQHGRRLLRCGAALLRRGHRVQGRGGASCGHLCEETEEGTG